MKKAGLISIILALFALAAGCGGNQAACEDYVESYNDLECVSQKLSVEETCPDALDDDDCDMEDYYACLTEETTCSNGRLSEPAAGKCKLACDEE
ncbi:MAG: hypothetical protein JXA30_12660 [Deltaproteobacteria bacterium]|nr:hypothetical protein [Deltaproteobacteria bacterium]